MYKYVMCMYVNAENTKYVPLCYKNKLTAEIRCYEIQNSQGNELG